MIYSSLQAKILRLLFLNLFTNITHPCLPHGGMKSSGLNPVLTGWNLSNYLIICILILIVPGLNPGQLMDL